MAKKKLRTIGKRVLRELERKLPPTILQDYEEVFRTYLKALTQERNTKDKIYSLHEPQVACIAKGKSGKNYEFGTKVAVVRGRKTGIISSIKRFSGNPHDSKTLEESFSILTGITNPAQLEAFRQEYRLEADVHMNVNTRLFPDTLSTLKELKKRGARVEAVA